MNVHLKDVAKRAGVSTATISRVLNGKGYVSDELRKRVNAAVAEMDYTPNGLARGMQLRRTFSLGLVVSDVRNEFFTLLARGVEDEGQERGYFVFLCNTDGDLAKERAYLRGLHEKRVDGIVLAPIGEANDQVRRLADAGIQVVLADRMLPDAQVPGVSCDNFGGAYKATEYLLSLGHRRVALISGKPGASTGRERLEGFQSAMEANGVAVEPALIVPGNFTEEGGRAAGKSLLNLPQPPTAVISCNNLMTRGMLLAVRSRGKSVPRDMSVVSFDDVPVFSILDRPLTVVSLPTYEMGRRACQVLVDMLEGDLPARRAGFCTYLRIWLCVIPALHSPVEGTCFSALIPVVLRLGRSGVTTGPAHRVSAPRTLQLVPVAGLATHSRRIRARVRAGLRRLCVGSPGGSQPHAPHRCGGERFVNAADLVVSASEALAGRGHEHGRPCCHR